MAKLDPQIAEEVAAHCRTTAGEIGQAFSRALGGAISLSVESSGQFDWARLRDESVGPGLAILLQVEEQGAVILVAEKSGILPEWYKAPDAAGQSKLTTLAQELGMLALPEPFLSDDSRSFGVNDFAAALREGGVADDAGLVRLTLGSGDQQGAAYLIWPLASLGDIKPAFAVAPTGTVAATHSSANTGQVANDSSIDSTGPAGGIDPAVPGVDQETTSVSVGFAADSEPDSPAPFQVPRPYPPQWMAHTGPTFRDLPPYTRSLLKIRVPLSVTLAAKKQPVGQILEIGPGSIIQFEKSCEEMLDLNVSNLAIARGEAVKVGEKFGLRVTSLILPGERFKPIRPV